LYDIAKSISFNNQQVVKKHEDTFLEEPEQIVYDRDYLGYYFFMGFFVTHRIYSISADVYDYYESIKEQLTAENEIFSPVPTRIRSNIFCVNNDAVSVVGVFEASSMLTLFMKCIISYGYLSSTELQSLPDGCPFFLPPEYPAITP
jgi:hypothetical protein